MHDRSWQALGGWKRGRVWRTGGRAGGRAGGSAGGRARARARGPSQVVRLHTTPHCVQVFNVRKKDCLRQALPTQAEGHAMGKMRQKDCSRHMGCPCRPNGLLQTNATLAQADVLIFERGKAGTPRSGPLTKAASRHTVHKHVPRTEAGGGRKLEGNISCCAALLPPSARLKALQPVKEGGRTNSSSSRLDLSRGGACRAE